MLRIAPKTRFFGSFNFTRSFSATPLAFKSISLTPATNTDTPQVGDDDSIMMSDIADISTNVPMEPLADIAMKIGDVAALGLGKWYTPPGLVENLFEAMHVLGGMPWYTTIITATLVVRCAIFPLALKQQIFAAKMKVAQPHLSAVMEQIKYAKAAGNDEMVKEKAADLSDMYFKYDVSPTGAIGPALATMPVFMSFFLALRDLANAPIPDMATGGMLWFTDLTIPDPYYALPILASGTFVLMIYKNMDAGMQANSLKVRNAIMAMGVLGMPLMATFPSALSLYWTVNNLFTITQAQIFNVPLIRKSLGIIEPKPLFTMGRYVPPSTVLPSLKKSPPITRGAENSHLFMPPMQSFREGFKMSLESTKQRGLMNKQKADQRAARSKITHASPFNPPRTASRSNKK